MSTFSKIVLGAFSALSGSGGAGLLAALLLTRRTGRAAGGTRRARRRPRRDRGVEVRRHRASGGTYRLSVTATTEAGRAILATVRVERCRPAPVDHKLAGRDARAARWRTTNIIDRTGEIDPKVLRAAGIDPALAASAGTR